MAEDTIYHYLNPKWYNQGHKKWLIGHVAQHWSKFTIISLFTIIAIIIQTYIPVIFGLAIDKAIPNKDINLIGYYSMIIIGLGTIRVVISYIAAILNEQIAQRVEMDVRVEYFDNLASKSMNFFNKAKVGDLMSQATQDTQNLTFSISMGLRSAISGVIGIIAAGIMMVYISPTLSIGFLIIIPFYIYYMVNYAKKLQPVSMERQERLANINAMLQENITGIRVVRTFSGQNREYSVFSYDVKLYEEVLIRRGAISGYFIPSLLLSLVTSIMFLAGSYILSLNAKGVQSLLIFGITIPITALTLGELIAFITIIGILLWPTNFLRFLLDSTMLGLAGAKRIFATLSTVSTLDVGNQITLDDINGNISFEDVDFSYSNDDFLAVDNFSLDIKQGERIAIIGPTGSGKSTVGRLLLRLYDIQSGSIKIDGNPISDIDLGDLRKHVGIIEQDTFLFSTSIRSNIAYGASNISEENIIKAAQAAQAHDFITQFKDGYDTILGERGITLSGGQRQRISMARTFITDPKILIMDDSTSAVDAETEANIQKALEKLLMNRTTIIITHRLSTLLNADKIVFMRKGKIERVGSHKELIETFQPYQKIFGSYPVPLVKEVIG